MTIAEELGRFAARASYDKLSDTAREQLKIRVLGAIINIQCPERGAPEWPV
jgi:hypothetical protein